jgi:methionyl-tRNA formyltransferase
VAIRDDDTTETLRERLSHDGAELLMETLYRLERGDLPAEPQDHTEATLAPILKKEDGRIDWKLSSRKLGNRIRGLRPWPGAYTTFRGKNLHIWAAAQPAVAEPSHHAPGTILVEAKRLLIACGQETLLEATELQLEGRKRLPARDFLNGLKLSLGEKLG